MPSTRPPPAPARGRVAYPAADAYTAGDAGAQPTLGESSTTQAQAIQAQAQAQAQAQRQSHEDDKPISTGGGAVGLLRRRTTTKRKPAAPPPATGDSSSNEARPDMTEREKSTQGLKNWWKAFSSSNPKPQAAAPTRVPVTMNTRRQFGVPLHTVLQYAGMSISTQAPDGSLNMWGEVPIAVARCGAYLKGKTDIEGVFRVSGSAKRMRDLQLTFDTGPDYGLHLDWSENAYTPHDVATIFRRFLTQMPEPVIPSSFYNRFRDVATMPGLSDDQRIREYKRLIRQMPAENQYLLLYVLDLLGIFAKESEKNLMTAANLAVIFQPGILHHRGHDMRPAENAVSKDVVKFLIDHEASFVFGMTMKIASRQNSGVVPTLGTSDDPGARSPSQQDSRAETPAAPPSPTPPGRRGSGQDSRTDSPTRGLGRPPVIRRESGDSYKTALEYPASGAGGVGGGISIPSAVPEDAVASDHAVAQPRPVPSSSKRPNPGTLAVGSSSSLAVSGLSPRTSSLAASTARRSPTSPRTTSPHTQWTPTSSRVQSPSVTSPGRPQARRADTDFMLPSDSDDEAPRGGYYIVEKPRSPVPPTVPPKELPKPTVADLLPEQPPRRRRPGPSRGQTRSAEPASPSPSRRRRGEGVVATGMYPSDSDDDAPAGGYIIYENKKISPSTTTLPPRRGALRNADGRTNSPKPSGGTSGATGLLRRKTLPSKRVTDFTNRMRRVVREA